MNLTQTMAFIHQTSWQGSRLGLERITELMRRLGDPQKELKFVHVAGTNGKGSVSCMLSSVLEKAGCKTALYTSPHLFRLNERMRINGSEITDDALCRLAEDVKSAVDAMEEKPTEFELITGMALLYFKKQGCDVVVLEVGLGGRLDSTNVIGAPELAIITGIGLEHTEMLGDTLGKIAAEKAGIIKPGCDVVLYRQSDEVTGVIKAQCAALGCPLTVTNPQNGKLLSCDLTGQRFDYDDYRSLALSLLGSYQYANAAVVLESVKVLIRRGFLISQDAVRTGLAAARWPARFELLQKEPIVLLDGAHNPNGVEALAASLRQYLPDKKVVFMMGVMADKDFADMLLMVKPFACEFITVTPDSPRSLPAEKLRDTVIKSLSLPATAAESVKAGVQLALSHCPADGAVCIFGSLYQAGEVRRCFGLD